MTLRELHERIAASSPAHWRVLPVGPGWPGEQLAGGPATAEDADGPDDPALGRLGHPHRAVLRSDVDLVLTWGLRESGRDYFEPWLGNLGRMTEVRADRIVLDVLWGGSLVDRLLGLGFEGFLLPFPRSRQPRVKGLPDRFFARDEAEPWRLVHELTFPEGPTFERVVHRSGLRVE
ncbi:unannotated protein [freshwater metagenome]|uniref:Unannotated protein n=1 Tax=freshwater metagenome TaxID=449393 RepID=A0A6J7GXL4_9ZZZZ|nr:hypothetical protein [Actinomycetota bacterium]